ncbi:hypothetical protein G6O69_10930 [Pseudenhygromyxa sp. WMMC2535]|uniref:rhodanese-like domain-containing protein n=1 Tax=Pseudenhygromyxa sp. WMMC2535 TaxID=2712867 RepID=UPI0015541020|nr:rhodanese-like domain-containing protein [Pseudenhygromyxa sp. WMMC2535]NVB38344.1 hypothetical protein [Pseudenhygromyxa sp. WMMC2535]
MLALLLLAALGVVTLLLARQLERLGDTALVLGASVLGGLTFLLAHPQMQLVAPPRDETCTLEEEPAEPAPAAARISLAEARERLGQPGVTFVDARPTTAYDYAHIPGAMSLPASDAEGLLEVQSLPIPPEGEVITYCEGGSCEQSDYLGALLAERDVCQQVRVLDGGWQAWIADEGPTVTGSSRFGDAGSSSVPAASEAPASEEVLP